MKPCIVSIDLEIIFSFSHISWKRASDMGDSTYVTNHSLPSSQSLQQPPALWLALLFFCTFIALRPLQPPTCRCPPLFATSTLLFFWLATYKTNLCSCLANYQRPTSRVLLMRGVFCFASDPRALLRPHVWPPFSLSLVLFNSTLSALSKFALTLSK